MSNNRENIEELLIDYIEGQLSGESKTFVESKIKEDPDINRMYKDYLSLNQLMEDSFEEAPYESLRADFQQVLEEEKYLKNKKAISIKNLTTTTWFKVAASVVLIVSGVMIGHLRMGYESNDQEITALKNDLEETRSLLNQVIEGTLSASQRLERIQASYNLNSTDMEILKVLIRTMNTDDNVNVRVAAIKALSGFTKNRIVRDALIQSLEQQEDPFIQIMLINILVNIKEKDAIQQLEKLIEKETVDQSVKDEAQLGIFQLS